MAGLFSIHTTKIFSISSIRVFHFLVIHVFTGEAVLISFRNFSFVFATWLIVWCKGPHSWSILAFDILSSLSLIISSF